MRGLKLKAQVSETWSRTSHLLQMRGLKLNNRRFDLECEESHLLQMRGLKRNVNAYQRYLELVASFTDAWIETLFPRAF